MEVRTLVFVVGTSPQVITETAYALAERDDYPIPTRVHAITTSVGLASIERELFGRRRVWAAFRKSHPHASRFSFSLRRVRVLRDRRGKPLPDVRSSRDSLAVADQISDFVARATQSESPPLHASIAGGRKTMGYLLAAAMMLHARPEDRLYHVLVHPPELEGSDFFFPLSRVPRTVTFRKLAGAARLKISSSDIRVELAELPFPRLRAVRGLTEVTGQSFTGLVESFQADLALLASPRLLLDPAEDVVVCGDRRLRLPPLRAVIYTLLARRRRNGCGAAACGGCERCFVPAREVAGPFRELLQEQMRMRQSHAVGVAWKATNFRPEVGKINATLRKVLHGAATPFEVKTRGKRGARLYGLDLRPDAIRLEEA